MLEIPCAHLITGGPERTAPRCELALRFPQDCSGCASYSPGLTEQERTRCEVWSRVMGYHRPISAYNAGKQQEHRDRVPFRERAAQTAPGVQFQEGAGHD